MKKKIDEFKAFHSAPECIFLQNMAEVYESFDRHFFADHVYHFSAVCPLDEVRLMALGSIRCVAENMHKPKERQ